jgi:hypothetical protein
MTPGLGEDREANRVVGGGHHVDVATEPNARTIHLDVARPEHDQAGAHRIELRMQEALGPQAVVAGERPLEPQGAVVSPHAREKSTLCERCKGADKRVGSLATLDGAAL